MRGLLAFVSILALGPALVACGSKAGTRLEEVANIESSVGAANDVKAENENAAKWAAAMEADLAARHSFYQAVSGSYEGAMDDGAGHALHARFTFTPSIPPYQAARVRTREEIAADLENLYFNVEVVQWDDAKLVVFGCVFEAVRPDLAKGTIQLVSADCASAYSLQIWDAESAPADAEAAGIVGSETSASVAAQAVAGGLSSVKELRGERRSTTRGSIFELSVSKVENPEPVGEPGVTPVDEETAWRIAALERDLFQRHSFYQAVGGTFEGKLGDSMRIRFTFTSSRPPYRPTRVRSEEEVKEDLAGLYLNAQVIQWDDDLSFRTGCVFREIRPDLATGRIELVSEDCPNAYSLDLSGGTALDDGTTQVLGGERRSVTKSSVLAFEVARVESATALPENLEAVSDEDEARRVRRMERDLRMRQRFYSAVSGVYEGTVATEAGEYQIRLTLLPSLPALPRTERVRSEDEVVADLEALSLRAQIVQWREGNLLTAVGCRVEEIRPDLVRGEISIASEDCPSVYLLRIAEAVGAEPPRASEALASAALSGGMSEITRIIGRIQPSTNASVYVFEAEKIRGELEP